MSRSVTKESKLIKIYSETSSLSPDEFWEGYRALIKILADDYIEKYLGDKTTHDL